MNFREQRTVRGRRRPSAGITPAAVLVTCLLAVTSAAWGGNVLVVLSTDAQPYREAFTSLHEHLTSQEQHVSFVLLTDLLEDEDKYLNDQTDACVGVGTQAAVWLHRNAAPDVTVAYCMVASPEDVGLTKGRPAHGVTTQIPLTEQIQFISRVLPRARTIGMIYNADSEKSRLLYERVAKAVPETWRLRAVSKDEEKTVAETIEELFSSDVDVVWTAPDSSIYDIPTVRTLLLAAMRHKTPVFGFSPQFVRAGALFGVGVSPADQGSQAAAILMRELKRGGADSTSTQESISPEPPKFVTAVNLIVAEKLGMELPRRIVREAQYVWPEPKDGETD